MITLWYNAVFADVDPPRDLTATNIQTDSATLTWKPPEAAVTGYTLTFTSADGVIRVRLSTILDSSCGFACLNPKTRHCVD